MDFHGRGVDQMVLDQDVKARGRPAVVLIDPEALASIEADARRCYPAEAIGLLARAPESDTVLSGHVVVSEAVALTNRARHPGVSVQVSRAERDQRLAELAERGRETIGAYHSHPDGSAEPSAADLQAVRGAGVEIIASAGVTGVGMVRAWWLERDCEPIELALELAPRL
ncbi:MAG TPA: Mov34/MPN/PAD-1 family protein [Candidatus Limnocylindrales bacterium]|nr:Mov34/MPN/PAD-1 family protein [Candidatus Limnocylindrales bacterium]